MGRVQGEALRAAAERLGWSGDESGIAREFRFPSYEAGVGFALAVALLAQRQNHHPDALSIGWCTVQVRYVTHSQGGVTDLDLQAAEAVNQLATA
jgi:4a-hydroxytetrahydrobiopterin dehydratase